MKRTWTRPELIAAMRRKYPAGLSATEVLQEVKNFTGHDVTVFCLRKWVQRGFIARSKRCLVGKHQQGSRGRYSAKTVAQAIDLRKRVEGGQSFAELPDLAMRLQMAQDDVAEILTGIVDDASKRRRNSQVLTQTLHGLSDLDTLVDAAFSKVSQMTESLARRRMSKGKVSPPKLELVEGSQAG